MKPDWKTVPLGEIVEVIGGGTPSKRNPTFYGGEIPWATVRDMNVQHISKTEHSITPAALKASSSKLIPAGEVVIATRVGLGKACILNQDTAINQDLRGLVPKPSKKIDRRFLFHWYNSVSDQVIAAGTGATVQGVKLPLIKGLPFPLLSLEEQQRIVAVLDEAFEGLARARAHAEANLQNSRDLFENYIDRAFAEPGECPFVELNELAEIVSGYSFSSGDFDASNPVKSIKITNVGLKEFVEANEANLPENYKSEFSRFSIPEGSIVVALTRTIISGGLKVAIVPEIFSGALLNQRVAALKFDGDDLLRNYLYLFLSSFGVVQYVREKVNTLMQPNLSINDLKRLPVPKLATQQQHDLVVAAGLLRDQVSELKKQYQSRIQDLDDLRQSLLQKAFAGELT